MVFLEKCTVISGTLQRSKLYTVIHRQLSESAKMQSIQDSECYSDFGVPYLHFQYADAYCGWAYGRLLRVISRKFLPGMIRRPPVSLSPVTTVERLVMRQLLHSISILEHDAVVHLTAGGSASCTGCNKARDERTVSAFAMSCRR